MLSSGGVAVNSSLGPDFLTLFMQTYVPGTWVLSLSCPYIFFSSSFSSYWANIHLDGSAQAGAEKKAHGDHCGKIIIMTLRGGSVRSMNL